MDTHCHVQFQAFAHDVDDVIEKCLAKGMILNMVGTQKDTSRSAVAFAERYDNVYASIGTHPIHLHPTHVDEEETHFMSREEHFDEAYYEELVQSKKVIGIGECGLDLYHLPKDISVDEVLAKQKEVFLAHLRFALKHDLPLVIHCREAHEEMIRLLQSEAQTHTAQIRGTIHCFTSHWGHAQSYLNMGFYLGFTGVVTFPPKKTNPTQQIQLEEVIQKIPLDRIVIETDSPYLAPQAYRGRRSEPWMVEEVVKKFATVRGLSFDEMTIQIAENSHRLFSRISLRSGDRGMTKGLG